MADFRPFPAYRPQKGYETRIPALPYDVFNTEEARQIVKDNPLSFLAIDRPETAFAPGTDPYAPFVYQKAHDLLWQQIADGYFVKEETPV
ncbi:MAG: DUF1015 domain-containing protein, partial [Lachnospiraceae bacterium]|nr:DUF1015 domain-containing protein [Lachnospiraceae bacterium]